MDSRRDLADESAESDNEGFAVVQAPAVHRWESLIRLLYLKKQAVFST